jgi:uncharacterized membrane protein
MAAALRGLTFIELATIGAVIFVFELRLGDHLNDYVAQNQVELIWRVQTLELMGTLAALVAIFCLGLAWRKGPAVATALERAGRIALPFVPLAALPALTIRPPWQGNELPLLVTTGAFGVVFESTLRRAFAALEAPLDRLLGRVPARAAAWTARVVVGAAVLYYAVRISQLTCLSHERLATSTSDLGEFDNLFFNALHGHPFRAPAIDGDLRDFGALKVHAEFVLYLLLPFYALRPGPQALLVIQSTVVAITAIPLYVFASRRAGRAAGAVIAIVFLLLPFVERPNFYDFHFVPVGMLFAATTICLVERCGATALPSRRVRWLFAASFVLTLLSREDVAIGMAVVGLFVALSGHNPRLGMAMAAASAVYFVVMKFVIMPRIGVMWFDAIYEDLKVPGQHGFVAVVNTLVSNPVFTARKLLTEAKLLYALHLTVPLLFLWLRYWPLLAAALPGFIFTLAVTNRPPMSESSFQYAYLWAPHVVAASALSLERLGATPNSGPAARRAALVALLVVATVVSVHQGALLGADTIRGGFNDKALSISLGERTRVAELDSLVRRIPAGASVVASEQVGPHVSTRLVFYSLKYTFGDKPEYVLVGNMGMPEERERVRAALAGDYGVVARAGPFFLARRGASKAANASVANDIR